MNAEGIAAILKWSAKPGPRYVAKLLKRSSFALQETDDIINEAIGRFLIRFGNEDLTAAETASRLFTSAYWTTMDFFRRLYRQKTENTLPHVPDHRPTESEL